MDDGVKSHTPCRQSMPLHRPVIIISGLDVVVDNLVEYAAEGEYTVVELCSLCKLLSNPLRLEMLGRVCLAADGVNVGVLADDLSQSGIGQSGVSQYLKQLALAGVVRRMRAGRYVNYVRCDPPVPAVRKAVGAIVQRMKTSNDRDFAYIFNVMMNPFRARVVAAVAKP